MDKEENKELLDQEKELLKSNPKCKYCNNKAIRIEDYGQTPICQDFMTK